MSCSDPALLVNLGQGVDYLFLGGLLVAGFAEENPAYLPRIPITKGYVVARESSRKL
mgnify:CR=1 FL=1